MLLVDKGGLGIFCPENSVEHWGSRGFIDRTHENAKGSGPETKKLNAQRARLPANLSRVTNDFSSHEELDNEFMCKMHVSHRITLEPAFPLLKKALIPAQDQDQG